MPRLRKVRVAEQENEVPVPVRKENTKKRPRQQEFTGDAKTVSNLFLSIQRSDCNSGKVIIELTKMYKKMGHDAFMSVFKKVVDLFLVRADNDEYAPRVLKFIGLFVASFGEDLDEEGKTHLIIQHVFKEFLGVTSALYHVRARICFLISNIMISFSQKAEIDEALMDHVIERMLTSFIKDTSPIVRQNAIMALQRLQEPDNTEDPVTKAYIYHMETDPAPKVRQAAVTAIAKKVSIMHHIIDRLRDTDEKVRRHTVLQMASFPVKSYKIADRLKIIKAALYDRSMVVKKAVNNVLLPNWIVAYDDDYAQFIKAFNLESSDDDIIKFRSISLDTLAIIFKKRKLSDLVNFLELGKENEFKNCLPLSKANSLEWLILWKAVINLHQAQLEGKCKENVDQLEDNDDSDEEQNNETISNIETIPELLTFCEYFDKFVSEFTLSDPDTKYLKIKFNHCIIVLLEIAQLNDFGDEIGRNRLQKLIKKLLLEFDVSEHAIKEISQVMELLIVNPEDRMKFFQEIVDEMVSTTTPNEYSRTTIIDELICSASDKDQLEATRLKLKMMDLKEQESKFVQEKLYGKAQKVAEDYTKVNQSLIELLKPYAEESSKTLLESMSSNVTAKKLTPASVLKNLQICFFAVMTKGVKSLTTEFLKIYKNFVRYYLESTDTSTRVWALSTATAYSLLYEPLAKDVYILLKGQLFKSNIVAIWEVTINCIVDLLLRYSIDKMDRIDDSNQEANASTQNRSKKGGRTLYTDGEDAEDIDIVASIDIIQMLVHVLDNNVEIKVHKATIIGLCKLIIHGQYYSREIISRFMIAYFNPATDAEINQTLGIFFESIVRLKKQESLHDALIPTLVTLLEAPYDSPLREVKTETVVKYVIGATRPVFCSNGLNLHNTLAMKLIEVLKDNPENKEILKIFSRELMNLEIGEDVLLKKDIVIQIENLMKIVKPDVRTKKNITDFRDMLKGTYRPSLKFSSTAAAVIAGDAGDPEDREEDDEEADEAQVLPNEELDDQLMSPRVSESPPLEMRESPVASQTPNASVSEDKSNAGDISTASSFIDIEAELKKRKLGKENQILSETASQEIEIPEIEITASQDIDIPETQEDTSKGSEEENDVGSESLNETVIENASANDESIEEIPETPEPKTPITRKSLNTKRHLEASITRNSPIPKSKRSNGTTPKLTKSTPQAATSATTLSTPSRVQRGKLLVTPTTKTSTPAREQREKVPVTPTAKPLTPARVQRGKLSVTPRTESPMTPKTPKVSALTHVEDSTPKSERMTRKQAREESAFKTTLTRSASRNMNIEPGDLVSKFVVTKQAEVKAPPVKVGKAVKKTSIPVPTKTSRIRASKAAAKNANAEPSTSSEAQGRLKRQRPAAEGKQRPRWT